MRETFDNVGDWFGDWATKILRAIGDVADWLFDVGRRIIKGLWEGMKDMWENVKGWLGGLGGIIESIKGPPSYDSVMLLNNGRLIIQGLHRGMMESWKPIEDWLGRIDPAKYMGNDLDRKMAKVLQGVLDGVGNISEFQPTITPVLDLTQVKNEASKIGGYISPKDLKPSLSLGHATVIARSKNPKAVNPGTTTEAPQGDVTFEQNIYSPTELSASAIYKQTRNQLAIAKEELGVPS
jgi:hypothetical protein